MRILMAACFVVVSPVLGAEPRPTIASITPRSLYVGCSLAVSGDELAEPKVANEIKSNSAVRCMLAESQMLANFRGEKADKNLKFCPEISASFDVKPFDAMSIAYIEFYEANGERLAKLSGNAALLLALRSKWPCDS